MTDENKLRDLVAQVAAAYFSNSHVNPAEIPAVMSQIATSLGVVKEPSAEAAAAEEAQTAKLTPAQIRKSIAHDGLVSFEDGKRYKTLKRHLSVRGMTPADYRAKWGLPRDYPMVSPSYSEQRSALAKTLGLGQKGGLRASKRAAPAAGNGAGPAAGKSPRRAAAKGAGKAPGRGKRSAATI